MKNFTNTYLVALDLDNYLKDNSYFEHGVATEINHQIVVSWDTRFKDAIDKDIKSKFDKTEIDFTFSQFDLTSEDSQGACIFLHKVIISEKGTLEFLKVFIKTLINYNKTTVYLDSQYSTIESWEGQSKTLKAIFDKLKSADDNFGYFNPISLADLVK